MKYILCYGDSNTWGRVPQTRERYDFPDRWTGVMQGLLGPGYHIYENALNGRTTVFEDRIEEGRNGRNGFEVTLLENSPMDLIILALGINDTKNRFHQTAWDIGWGMNLLVQLVLKAGCGREGGAPKILLVPPIQLNDQWGNTLHGTLFSQESIAKCRELPEIYETFAQRNGCGFLNPNLYIDALGGDGIHLTRESHAILGRAMADKVRELIG